MMSSRTHTNRGFTLIELLAVAAVVAMAGIGTILLLTRGNQKAQVLQTGQQLALAARAARIHAVQYGQSCRLVMDREQGRFYVMGKSPEADETEEETILSNPFTKPVQLPDTVQFEMIQILGQEPDLTEIEFGPNGSARTAIIQIGDGKNRATVTILEATGRVKMTPGELSTLLADQADLDEIQPVY
jgi:prepilin-type N-terminal cleavage/methylation domain-containing protein